MVFIFPQDISLPFSLFPVTFLLPKKVPFYPEAAKE